MDGIEERAGRVGGEDEDDDDEEEEVFDCSERRPSDLIRGVDVVAIKDDEDSKDDDDFMAMCMVRTVAFCLLTRLVRSTRLDIIEL